MKFRSGFVGRIVTAAFVVLLAVATQLATAANSLAALTTVAEQSGNTRTGRYDEVRRLCGEYARRWPKQVRCVQFGRSPEGRPMLYTAVMSKPALSRDSQNQWP